MPCKGLIAKPMVFKELNFRCQVDLIDMQNYAGSDYRFIFNYQDHLNKFVFLHPLKTKRAEGVGYFHNNTGHQMYFSQIKEENLLIT
jgi:hypothetical protein